MTSCRDIEPLFASFVDGEASPQERASVQAHLDRCPPCREVVSEERTARNVLIARRTDLRACASANLRSRCAAQCVASRAFANWRTLVPLSVAATLLLAVAGVFVYSAVDRVGALAAQVTADHVKCKQVGSPSPEDPVTSARDWGSSYGWHLTVPASAPERGLEFLTVRRCLVTDGRVAHMMYLWRGRPLSVFVLPMRMNELERERLVERFGHEAVMWSSEGRTYVLVAQGAHEEIGPVATYVRANAR